MMAMMLPSSGVLKVTSDWVLAEQSTDNRHDNGSGSKIDVVLLNNATKIVQAERNDKKKPVFLAFPRRSLSCLVTQARRER